MPLLLTRRIRLGSDGGILGEQLPVYFTLFSHDTNKNVKKNCRNGFTDLVSGEHILVYFTLFSHDTNIKVKKNYRNGGAHPSFLHKKVRTKNIRVV